MVADTFTNTYTVKYYESYVCLGVSPRHPAPGTYFSLSLDLYAYGSQVTGTRVPVHQLLREYFEVMPSEGRRNLGYADCPVGGAGGTQESMRA